MKITGTLIIIFVIETIITIVSVLRCSGLFGTKEWNREFIKNIIAWNIASVIGIILMALLITGIYLIMYT